MLDVRIEAAVVVCFCSDGTVVLVAAFAVGSSGEKDPYSLLDSQA